MFNKLIYWFVKDNPKAFERDFATVVYKNMDKKHFTIEWNILKDRIKKNLYNKGLCKVI